MNLTEKDILRTIIDGAKALGLEVYHVFEQYQYAHRTSKGFPDLVLARPPRLVFGEVKSLQGKLTPDQERWIAILERCNVEVYVFRSWEEAEGVLRGERSG